MKKIKLTIKTILVIISLSMIFSNSIFAVALSIKSEKDMKYTINILRKLTVIIGNFPENKAKDRFNEIQKSFEKATVDFYGQNYDDSFKKYKSLKQDLIILLKDISKDYLFRTKTLLDSTSTESVNILLNYSRNSPVMQYFRKPYNPFDTTPKPYDVKKFHLFTNKEKIEAYLRIGYKKYNTALKIFNDPELEVLAKKKRITSNSLNYSLNKYMRVIKDSRIAKQYGIEIYKILFIEKLIERERIYGYSRNNHLPVFDDRIPDQYKVDANDNLNLSHEKEMEKLGGFKYKEGDKSKPKTK